MTTPPAAAVTVADPPPPPGAIMCPSCRGLRWHSSRPFLFWLLVVLTFPLGLLLLLIRPAWKCAGCGYAFKGGTPPPSTIAPEPTSVGYQIAKAVAVTVLVLLVLFLVMMVMQNHR